MSLGAATPHHVGEPLTIFENVNRFGWLFMDSYYAGMRALWGNGGFQWPDSRAADIEGIYGIGFFLIGVAGIVTLAVQYKKTKDRTWLIMFGLSLFSLMTFVVNLLLIIFRLRFVQGSEAVIPYLIGSRYVIFPAFYMVMFGGSVLVLFARTFGSIIVYPAIFAASTSIVGTYWFALTLMGVIWPYTQINSSDIWSGIVNGAKRNLEVGRPIDNVDLKSLDPEFKFDLKGRRHLLVHDLKCVGCVHFDE